MCGGVDAAREAADDRNAANGELAGQPDRHIERIRCGGSGPHDRDRRQREDSKVAPRPEDRRRVRDAVQQRGIAGIEPGNRDHPCLRRRRNRRVRGSARVVFEEHPILAVHPERNQDFPGLSGGMRLAKRLEHGGRAGARDAEHRHHHSGMKIHSNPSSPHPSRGSACPERAKGPAPRLRSSSAARPLCLIIRPQVSPERRPAVYATRSWLTEKAGSRAAAAVWLRIRMVRALLTLSGTYHHLLDGS